MTAETNGASPQGASKKTSQSPGQRFIQSVTSGKGKKNDDDDDDDSGDTGSGEASNNKQHWAPWSSLFRSVDCDVPSSSTILSGMPLATLCVRTVALATITLYVLNQKHMLPKPIGQVVSKLLFWPTIPITVSRRIGKWTTVVDNAVVLGGAPFGWCRYPEKLSRQFNVKGVVNMCEEYRGPVSSYRRLGIEHLRLPTVDHFEPSVEDLKKAVSFVQKHESQGGRVYVHCRAGHGRSAAAVYAWLLYKEPLADPVELNEKLCSIRNVRKSLWKQPNINIFREWLGNGGMMSDSDSEDANPSWRSQQNEEIRNPKRPANNHHPESETEDSCSDDNAIDGGIVTSKFGQVFSDEEDSTTEAEYSSEENDIHHDVEYDDDISEDDKDYEMWRSYRRNDL